MDAYVVYAHPTRQCFTGEVLAEFCRGLSDGGHSYELGDLYEMQFNPEMTMDEYRREMNVDGTRATSVIPTEVKTEHEKIDRADGLAFVFPLWWGECPAKLKGWFDRVWICGYAYEYAFEKETYPFQRLAIERALVLCTAGNTRQGLEESGIAGSMKRLYTHDRLRPDAGVGHCEFALLPGMADPESNQTNGIRNLKTAYHLGKNFLQSLDSA